MNDIYILCAVLSTIGCIFSIKLFLRIRAQLAIWLMIAFIYGTTLRILLALNILGAAYVGGLMLIFWALLVPGMISIYTLVKHLNGLFKWNGEERRKK